MPIEPTENPFEDRITQILEARAQPQQFTPETRDAAALSSQYLAQAGQTQGVEQVLDAIGARQRDQQQRELESATALYDLFEQKRAAGDAQANALFERIKMFTGGDPAGTQMFIEELENDPEEVDPGNAFQVMSKLAGIAKRTNYKSPKDQEFVEIKGQPGFVRMKGSTQAFPIEGLPAGALIKPDVKGEKE